MVSGVPLVPFSECKITDFSHSHQMFSQLFFKKFSRNITKALHDNALNAEKISYYFRMVTDKVIKRPFDAQIFYGANNSDEVICAISEVLSCK